MPIDVTMLKTVMGENGVAWTDGNSYRASDAFALELVRNGAATAYGGLPRLESSPTAPQARTVLWGDSMTDWYHQLTTPSGSTVTYDVATRLMTIPYADHRAPPGTMVAVWHYGYPSFRHHRRYKISTLSDVNNVRIVLDPDHGVELPNGALSSNTFFMRVESRRSCANAWVNFLQMFTGWKLDIVRNAAQSGISMVLAKDKVASNVLSYAPSLVIGNTLGINDEHTIGALPITPFSEWKDAAELCFDQILNSGARLLLLNITPTLIATDSRGTLQVANRLQLKNRFVARYARRRRNMQIIDSYTRMVDPTSAAGEPKAIHIRSADGVHRSIYGSIDAARMAKVYVDNWFPGTAPDTLPNSVTESWNASLAVSPTGTYNNEVVTITSTAHGRINSDWFRARAWTQSQANIAGRIFNVTADTFDYRAPGLTGSGSLTGSGKVGFSRQCYSNPLLTTLSGTITPITNVTINGTASTDTASGIKVTAQSGATGTTMTASIAARADGFGNDQVLTITACSTGDKPTMEFVGTTVLMSELIKGRTYRLECEINLVSADWSKCPIDEIVFQHLISWDGVAYMTNALQALGPGDGPNITSGSETFTLHIRCQDFTTPETLSAFTKASFLFYIRAQDNFGAGASLAMKLGRLSWLDVTDD